MHDIAHRSRQGHGTAIRLVGCAKTFADRTRGLAPLDLEIKSGETLVLLGPSGCGKTTTLRIIAGLETPDSGGQVFFGDRDVTAIPIERRNVGMVFQSYALFPNMTVAGNIAYGLKVRGVAAAQARERVDEMLAMMHIAELRDRRVDQISGGQRQRVAVARALAVRPDVLLLDEPLTALDAKLRDNLRIEIDTLLRSLGITAVYVTHDQGEAMALGDRIVVMNRGKVEQIGSPREIYFEPATRFVADFIGTMNRLPGVAAKGRLSLNGGTDLPWSGADGLVEVLFRPQDVTFCEPGAAHVTGSVRASFFLGERVRVVIAAAGHDVVVEADARHNIVLDQVVGLELNPERLLSL